MAHHTCRRSAASPRYSRFLFCHSIRRLAEFGSQSWDLARTWSSCAAWQSAVSCTSFSEDAESIRYTRRPNEVTGANAGKHQRFAEKSRVGLSPRPGVAISVVSRQTRVRGMTTITTREDFDAFLHEEQAILFAFFDWSGQAHSSLRVFEEWEREWHASHPTASVSFYRLDPDRYTVAGGWLAEQARGDEGLEGGFGSVTWLRRGKGVGFVPYAAKAGKDTLSRLTDEYFGSLTSG